MRKTDYSEWQWSDLGACLFLIWGLWWLCSWTSVPEDLWQHCRKQETLSLVCILGICRNDSSISLSFWHTSSQLSLIELLPSGFYFLFFFFLLNNPSCISGSVKPALFHRILLAFSWLPFKTLLSITMCQNWCPQAAGCCWIYSTNTSWGTTFPACIGILAYKVIHTKVHFCCLVEILSSLPLQGFSWLNLQLFLSFPCQAQHKGLIDYSRWSQGKIPSRVLLTW